MIIHDSIMYLFSLDLHKVFKLKTEKPNDYITFVKLCKN